MEFFVQQFLLLILCDVFRQINCKSNVPGKKYYYYLKLNLVPNFLSSFVG